MQWIIVFLFLVLLTPGTALAQDWYTGPGQTGAKLVGNRALKPTATDMNPVAWFDFSNTTDSVTLDVRQCKSVDVFFVADTAASAEVAGAEVNIRNSLASTVSANTSFPIYTDTDGGGVDAQTLNGDSGATTAQRAAIYGASAVWVYVDITANPSSEAARVAVKCNGY